jgi:uncharacterized membrane protein YdjX (TVP38/TMEM64 family)
MRRLIAFLTSMDARAWRGVAMTFVLFGGVGLVFLFGARVLGFGDAASVNHWLAAARGPWSLPLAVGAFALLAFVGVPQFVLIAAAVVAFGPWRGLAYSWTGTMASSLVGFWLGRLFGARLLASVPSQGLERFLTALARNGLMASLVVRLVPFAPFIMVNMAAGMTPMRLADFAIGTAIGIIPKIALTAFAGNSVVQVMNGGGLAPVVLLMAAVAVWLAAGWAARLWLRR